MPPKKQLANLKQFRLGSQNAAVDLTSDDDERPVYQLVEQDMLLMDEEEENESENESDSEGDLESSEKRLVQTTLSMHWSQQATANEELVGDEGPSDQQEPQDDGNDSSDDDLQELVNTPLVSGHIDESDCEDDGGGYDGDENLGVDDEAADEVELPDQDVADSDQGNLKRRAPSRNATPTINFRVPGVFMDHERRQRKKSCNRKSRERMVNRARNQRAYKQRVAADKANFVALASKAHAKLDAALAAAAVTKSKKHRGVTDTVDRAVNALAAERETESRSRSAAASASGAPGPAF